MWLSDSEYFGTSVPSEISRVFSQEDISQSGVELKTDSTFAFISSDCGNSSDKMAQQDPVPFKKSSYL